MTAPRFVPNDKIIERMTPEQRKELGLKTRDEIDTKLAEKDEKTIQIGVESWLRLRGYWPRTPAFLDGKAPEKGWYIHLHQSKKNPIILDLLILSHDGRYLELELKTAKGPVRPQQEAILKGRASIARSIKEAVEEIQKWESQNEDENRQ